MIYSTLVERVVKSKRAREDTSKANGTTFKEFFGKFPSLHPFFLQHL